MGRPLPIIWVMGMEIRRGRFAKSPAMDGIEGRKSQHMAVLGGFATRASLLTQDRSLYGFLPPDQTRLCCRRRLVVVGICKKQGDACREVRVLVTSATTDAQPLATTCQTQGKAYLDDLVKVYCYNTGGHRQDLLASQTVPFGRQTQKCHAFAHNNARP